jgi:ARG/rhodanese/phosphatase superfamily protein
MQTIHETLGALKLGEAMRVHNLSVFPLMAEGGSDPGYITLDEALEGRHAHVTETSEAGHVPELRFENDSAHKILLVDGEELVGAKQNRVLNLTILVAAGQKLTIPVSCVEQGRWSYRSHRFGSAKRTLFAKARAAKMRSVSASLRERGMRSSDQGQVWQDIAEKAESLHVSSMTGAAGDIYEQRQAELANYEGAIEPRPGQSGAVFAIGGRVVGAELFDSPMTFAKHLKTLVASYALDAMVEPPASGAAVGLEQVQAFLQRMEQAVVQRVNALGEGEDLRLSGEGLEGGALYAEGRIIHLCAFDVEPKAEAELFE